MIGGNGSASLTLTATQNEINTTLAAMSPAFTGPPAVAAAPNGLIYTPAANYNGADTLTIVTNDKGNNGNDPGNGGTGTTEADIDTKTINIADVNDAPTVTDDGPGFAATILEDTPFTNVDAPTVATLFGGQLLRCARRPGPERRQSDRLARRHARRHRRRRQRLVGRRPASGNIGTAIAGRISAPPRRTPPRPSPPRPRSASTRCSTSTAPRPR